MNGRAHYDLAVIGGGSGGFAAAYSGARLGLNVVVVEKMGTLGGTATVGGVNTWEPSVSGTGIALDIYRRLERIPGAAGIYSIGRHFGWQDDWYWPHALEKVNFPGGESVIDPNARYEDTLRRHCRPGETRTEAFCRRVWHGVTFEPEICARVMLEMLKETGRCTVKLDSTFREVHAADGRVVCAVLSNSDELTADFWVDGTGDGVFAIAAGADHYVGMDARSRFNEPSAPDEVRNTLNGVSLIFRVTPTGTEAIEPLPADIPSECWWAKNFPPICCNHYPGGDRNCNMLPTMEGEESARIGYDAAYAECMRRVKAQWYFLQTHFPEFRRFRISWIAPLLGIRESNRIQAEYMLTELDIQQGVSRQAMPDIISIADHALDRHGEGGGCPEVNEPYGIPYRSLVPMGFRNLLVACRSAGFSAIAATSARLTRTIMQLGQAAGTAAALSKAAGCDLPDVPPDALRASLTEQGVVLDPALLPT